MRLYLDTSVLRRCVEGDEVERPAAIRWIERAEAAPGGTILASRLARAECLVLPLRNRDPGRIEQFEELFRDHGIVLVGISDEILELASQIFADYGIKMADAIHTATAILGRCDALVAKDASWIKKGPVLGLPLLPFMEKRSS